MDFPVIYIAGSGRCGSTLLERVLGEIPGYVNVGELIQMARETAPRNKRCGCGQPFAECPFWTAVGKRAFGGWDSQSLEAIKETQARMTHRDYLNSVSGMGADQEDMAFLGAWFKRVLQAGVDVRAIHLIRDVRGVAFSMSKRHAASPDPANKVELDWSTSPPWRRSCGSRSLARRNGSARPASRWRGCVTRTSSGSPTSRSSRPWASSVSRSDRLTCPTSATTG